MKSSSVAKLGLLLLLASVFGMISASSSATGSNNIIVPFVWASTDGGEQQSTESSDDQASTTEEEEGDEEAGQPNEKPTIPESEPEPQVPPLEIPEPEPEPLPELPPCDGSAQDCLTENGDVCLEGQGGHECECVEDMSDCPLHPSLLPPLENSTSPPPSPFLSPELPPPSDTCMGGPPGVDGCPPVPPREGPDEDCLFDPSLPKCTPLPGEDCPGGFFTNEDGQCFPQHDRCPTGFHGHEDDESGRCIPDSTPCDKGFIMDPDFPTCSKKGDVCKKHPNIDVCEKRDHRGHDRDRERNFERVKVIVKNIDINKVVHNHNAFPDVDIIGLSIKAAGSAQVCLMEIDDDKVQCQEFAVPDDRINDGVWRIIETDHDKDFDNGNTGSDKVDDTIKALTSFDLKDLDTNHDFGADLAAVGINPVGDGLICLIDDPEGTSLCEPFKVDDGAIDGQITEITEIG